MGNTINFFEDGENHYEEERLQAELDKDVIKCVIREKNVCSNAHDGYLYCLLHAKDVPNMEGEVLISGSGDGDVKVRKLFYMIISKKVKISFSIYRFGLFKKMVSFLLIH
jgi:hypothetical protein